MYKTRLPRRRASPASVYRSVELTTLDLVVAKTVLQLTDVHLVRGERTILHDVSWQVQSDERWVVLGQNGSGKTTLCKLASLYIHPSRGTIDVLGRRLGRVDVRELRTHIGFTSAAVERMLRPTLTVSDAVVTGKHAALAPYWHEYSDDDRERARQLLDRFGCERLVDERFGNLSSGERQRVLLARTLMSEPSLLLLDEPTAGLDLGGREQLVSLLGRFAASSTAPATVMVTHHVDEIPPGFTHALLLRDGRILSSGPTDQVLTQSGLSECFGLPLNLERRDGRWLAWGAASPQ
jgi:iron complex transport system ATP-binding protein